MINKDLKRTPEMARIEEREKMLRKRDIILSGEPVDFGTPFIEAIKKVTGIEIDKMEFYYCVLRPEHIDKKIKIEFDYYGKAKKIGEIKQWHEILPIISVLYCGPYILQYYGSNFIPINEIEKKIRIKYYVSKNPEFQIEKKNTIKSVSVSLHKIKKEEISRKKKEVKNGKSTSNSH